MEFTAFCSRSWRLHHGVRPRALWRSRDTTWKTARALCCNILSI